MSTVTQDQATNVQIVSKPAFKVAGLIHHGKPMSQEIPQLWGKFDAYMGKIPHAVQQQIYYGLCDNMDEQTGEFDYMAAVEVERGDDMPDGIVVWEVPAATFAVFPTTLTEIGATFERIYSQWLPASGYQRAPGPDIEYYPADFEPDTPGSIFYLYIPVK